MANNDWLAKTQEEAIEPDLPICDAHHHLWNKREETVAYLHDDLLADTQSGHNVVSTVFIECMAEYRSTGPEELRPVGETEFVEAIANTNGDRNVIDAIVGLADLTLGERVRPVLEAHISASPRFRGIRHAAGWDPSPDVRNSHTNPPQELYRTDKFREGFACLVDMDLTFEAWQFHPQLEELAELASAFPSARIVVNHLGGPVGIGPYRREQIVPDWRKGIQAVAACSNVVIKLGGLAMPLNGFGWHKQPAPPSSEKLAEATRDYYLFCIDQFGPERCMFESNFPVDKISCSYTVLWNSFKRITAHLPTADRANLFQKTATNFYRIQP